MAVIKCGTVESGQIEMYGSTEAELQARRYTCRGMILSSLSSVGRVCEARLLCTSYEHTPLINLSRRAHDDRIRCTTKEEEQRGTGTGYAALLVGDRPHVLELGEVPSPPNARTSLCLGDFGALSQIMTCEAHSSSHV